MKLRDKIKVINSIGGNLSINPHCNPLSQIMKAQNEQTRRLLET